MQPFTCDEKRAIWWQSVRRSWPMLVFVAVIIAAAVLVNVWAARNEQAGTPAQDEAAKERARQFLRDLELEPGPVTCRSERSGSAWCTIREGSTMRFFQLFCSGKHPTCVENAVGINP